MNHVFIYALPTDQSKEARISEIAAVRVNGFGPYERNKIQKSFLGIVGIERDIKSVLTDLYKDMIAPEPYAMVSYNNEITRSLLRIENEKTGIPDGFTGRVWIDVNQLAWPIMISGQSKGRSLDALCAHFGVKASAHNDAADTCTEILQIYGLMMRKYLTVLKAESVMREVGGDTLEGLRKMIGF